mmetsp:Transcript_43385/g.94484  ORF Transcript_43385/g.94484 Transcript_43385/m.94484 type:complete len:243 (+) Transcript_43385:1358-2086(+)
MLPASARPRPSSGEPACPRASGSSCRRRATVSLMASFSARTRSRIQSSILLKTWSRCSRIVSRRAACQEATAERRVTRPFCSAKTAARSCLASPVDSRRSSSSSWSASLARCARRSPPESCCADSSIQPCSSSSVAKVSGGASPASLAWWQSTASSSSSALPKDSTRSEAAVRKRPPSRTCSLRASLRLLPACRSQKPPVFRSTSSWQASARRQSVTHQRRSLSSSRAWTFCSFSSLPSVFR